MKVDRVSEKRFPVTLKPAWGGWKDPKKKDVL